MAKKVVVVILLIAAVSIYLTWKEEGDAAFGGAFEPIQSVRPENTHLVPGVDPLGAVVTGRSVPDASQTQYEQMAGRVRSRVNDAMDQSERRAQR